MMSIEDICDEWNDSLVGDEWEEKERKFAFKYVPKLLDLALACKYYWKFDHGPQDSYEAYEMLDNALKALDEEKESTK